MKITPILMQGDMVRALLREVENPGTGKTQSRRLRGLEEVNGPTSKWEYRYMGRHKGKYGAIFKSGEFHIFVASPYGGPGDLLWVRETFVLENTQEYHGDHMKPTDGRPVQEIKGDPDWYGDHCLIPHYRATEPEPNIVTYEQDEDDDRTRWSPAIHMKRWSSRITLPLASVTIERLQDICDGDCYCEGIESWLEIESNLPRYQDGTPAKYNNIRQAFRALWESINGAGSWDKNPYVWRLEFKPALANVDELVKLSEEYSDDKIPWHPIPERA